MVAETGIELIQLFGYEYTDYSVHEGQVQFTARALMPGAANVTVTASRMINGRGFDLRPKAPLAFGAPVDARIVSLAPPDLGVGGHLSMIKYPRGAAGLIVVVGSGKTAMDCMIKLAELGESVTRRVRCVAGRGTYFAVREEFAGPDGGQHILSMLELFDGENGLHVLREMEERGFLHSPVPDPSSFQVGVCARAEVELVREHVLSPPEQRVVKAHLLDITVDPSCAGGVLLHLRPTRQPGAGGATTMALPPGSFIINCTDQIGEHPSLFDPIVSDDGLVLSPQAA